jgi:1-phosphofructokinase
MLAERTLEFDHGWTEGRTQRASRESFQVGGKGFNVAKMLHRLGGPVTALGFAGGAAGNECRDWLAQHAAYPHRLFASTVPTRTGVVIRAAGRAETTFFAPDRAADAAALAACAQFLDPLPATALLALCGSFPGWLDASCDRLRTALSRRAQTGGLVVDTYGPPLANLIQEPLRLVKINRTEFDGLWEATRRGKSLEHRLKEALNRWPVKAWIVTDGPAPVWWASADGVQSVAPPRIDEVSATGSGDVLLAGVLNAWWLRSLSLPEALQFALPLAAANAASASVADFALPLKSGNLQFPSNNPLRVRS